MTQEEANTYWASRDVKKWVVSLKSHETRLVRTGVGGQYMLQRANPNRSTHVSARTAEGARKTALDNLFGSDRMAVTGVRLATAHDLGCVRVPS